MMELYLCTGGEGKNCEDEDEIYAALENAKFVVLNNQIRFNQFGLASDSILKESSIIFEPVNYRDPKTVQYKLSRTELTL